MQLNLLEAPSSSTKFSTLSMNNEMPIKAASWIKNDIDSAPVQLKFQQKLKIFNIKTFRDSKAKRSKTIGVEEELIKKRESRNYFSTKKLTIIDQYQNMKIRQKLANQVFTYREMKVKKDNQKLYNILKTYEVNRKDYKRRIQTQVQQYLTLRENIRKFKKGKSSPGENFDIKIVKKGEEYKKFLSEAIQETKRKISQKQFCTVKTQATAKQTES